MVKNLGFKFLERFYKAVEACILADDMAGVDVLIEKYKATVRKYPDAEALEGLGILAVFHLGVRYDLF